MSKISEALHQYPKSSSDLQKKPVGQTPKVQESRRQGGGVCGKVPLQTENFFTFISGKDAFWLILGCYI